MAFITYLTRIEFDEGALSRLPDLLAGLGVTEAMMEGVAGEALKDHCHATNPRVATRADDLDLMREAA